MDKEYFVQRYPDCSFPYLWVSFSNRGRSTRPMKAVLDSGSFKFMIPKVLADYLGLTLRSCVYPYGTAGGPKKGHDADVELVNIGREHDVSFRNVAVAVIDANTPVLIGRDPFFKKYVVIIDESRQSVECIRSDVYSKRSE